MNKPVGTAAAPRRRDADQPGASEAPRVPESPQGISWLGPTTARGVWIAGGAPKPSSGRGVGGERARAARRLRQCSVRGHPRAQAQAQGRAWQPGRPLRRRLHAWAALVELLARWRLAQRMMLYLMERRAPRSRCLDRRADCTLREVPTERRRAHNAPCSFVIPFRVWLWRVWLWAYRHIAVGRHGSKPCP